MPRIVELPRLRTHVRKGAKNGQVWTSYFWDGRAFGLKDVPLGTDYEAALTKWRGCEAQIAATVSEDARALAGMMLRAVGPLPLPGVYFMIDTDDAVLYVGQSADVAKRLSGHAVEDYADVKMVPIQDEARRMAVEKAFIRFLAPPRNKVSTITDPAPDVTSHFPEGSAQGISGSEQ